MLNNISIVGENCYGCRSCEQICPQKCIAFEDRGEGFLYPAVNVSICLNCGKCLMVCPAKNAVARSYPIAVYGFKNHNQRRIINSASGGASDVFANYIFSHGGIIFGVAYDERMLPINFACKSREDLNRIQSSKYVASDTKHSYSETKVFLDQGIEVLYFGTPCQIQGLLLFLQKKYSNLYTISIICHGTPSYKAFRLYLDALENTKKSHIVDFNFRCKHHCEFDKDPYVFCASFENGKKYYKKSIYTAYGLDFFNAANFRESCYRCQFATPERVGDICIGDYLGITKKDKNFYDKKGVSIVIINSENGFELFNKIKNSAETITVDYEYVVLKQTTLRGPTKRHYARDTFYTNLNIKYYQKNVLLRRWIGRIMPLWMKKIIQRRKYTQK